MCFEWHSEHTATVSLYNVKVLQSQGGKEYPTYNKEQGNRTGHILRSNCLLEHANEGKIEGRIEVMGRRVRRHKQLLIDLKEEKILETVRGTLDPNLRTTRCGGGCGFVVRMRNR